jgi:hypothetical protein
MNPTAAVGFGRGPEIVLGGSLLATAFDHHVGATLRVIDACVGLSADELATNVPGTRGPIVDTLRHLVESDAFDLFILTVTGAHDVETGSMSLPEVRGVMERNGAG